MAGPLATYVLEWAGLLLRWAHVVVAIAWIGSSFYFVFLDASLTRPTSRDLLDKGVGGELWAVHGGGFYNPQKYLVAPKSLPTHLHWFFWESYSTWLTGFALFTVLYLFNAGSFLVDRNVHDWTAAAAVAAALAFLAVFWGVYDQICRRVGETQRAKVGSGETGLTGTREVGGDLAVGVLVAAVVAFASWLACALFAGRAAFLIVGAMLATAMSANVYFWIIPGQRKVIAQMRAGQPVDPLHGQRAKQRSVHNTYFTLPVLIAMISNHHGWLHSGPRRWLVLLALMLAGALIRHSFVARHKALVQGRRVPWAYAGAGVALLLGVALALAPAPAPAPAPAAVAPRVGTAQVAAIAAQRCAMCHNAQVQQKNVALHTPALLRQHAQAVFQQVVVLRAMPLNNVTGITEAERDAVRRWFEAGLPDE